MNKRKVQKSIVLFLSFLMIGTTIIGSIAGLI
jgi:hypothetical protein